ncbi:hypothetical protein Q5O24_12455 [Eubacteriaceae bacterium ES3]|nr:hypothetical protein Q5O24_12455 [Eubacteriaceae bacterium ES3]
MFRRKIIRNGATSLTLEKSGVKLLSDKAETNRAEKSAVLGVPTFEHTVNYPTPENSGVKTHNWILIVWRPKIQLPNRLKYQPMS